MNISQQKRLRIPIVFDSDDSYDSYSSYDESEYESQDSDDKPEIIIKPEIKPQPKKTFVPRPPVNNLRPIPQIHRRPILKPHVNSPNQRANSVQPEHHQNPLPSEHQQNSLSSDHHQNSVTSEHHQNSLPLECNKINQEQHYSQNNLSCNSTQSNSGRFEINQPEFVEPRTYAIVETKKSGMFKKSRTFTFLDKGNSINQVSLRSSKGKIKLSDDVNMYIRNDRSEFVFKSNDKKKSSLASVIFSIPYSFEDCKRKTAIRFGHSLGNMLPHKIVSLPTADESVFDGHYYIKSKRNVAFAIVNNSKPVLIARQIKKNMMEIETILNIPPVLLFGFSIALYIGKNKVPENDIIPDETQKFQILSISRILNHD